MARHYTATKAVGEQPLQSLTVDAQDLPASGPPVMLDEVNPPGVLIPKAGQFNVIDFTASKSFIYTEGLFSCLAFCVLYNRSEEGFERASLAHAGHPRHGLVTNPANLIANMPLQAQRWLVVCVRESFYEGWKGHIAAAAANIAPDPQVVIYGRKDTSNSFGVNFRGEFGEV